MKIAISYPPLAGPGSPMLTQNRQFQWYHVPSYIYPLVSASAATLLARDGFDVLWNDAITARWSWDQFTGFVEREQPDLIACETKTPVVRQHWHIVGEVKRLAPQCRTVLMGDHVTALPLETMENSAVDYVITGGDYDVSLLALARHLRDGAPLPPGIYYREGDVVRDMGSFCLDHDLNSLPFIDRRLTQAHLYGEKWKRYTPFFYTMAGRDCPWARCTFCAWTTLYPRFRVRRPEHLLDEIGFLIEQHGAREIFDDTGTFPAGGWLRGFCQGMVERDYNRQVLFSCNMRYGYIGQPDLLNSMKRAGFRKLKMGLESANQTTLDRLNKGITVEQIVEESRLISEAGLDIHLTIMVGYPWETRGEAQRTVDLARELMARGHAEMLQSTVIVPYPGTPLHAQAVEHGWFRPDIAPLDYERYDMREPVLAVAGMTPAEVMALSARVYRSFLDPRFVWRNLRRIRSWRDLGYVWRGAKAVIGHLRDFLHSRGHRGMASKETG
jgi:anaerobic magnesium-protoporphyrin IX monomethyl ester cyclase